MAIASSHSPSIVHFKILEVKKRLLIIHTKRRQFFKAFECIQGQFWQVQLLV